MTHASPGLDTSSHPRERVGLGSSTSSWYASVARWLWWGLAIRLALAPTSSMEADVSVWWNVVHHTTQGVGLYQFRLFSYPPVYGYWLSFLGGVLHVVGASTALLGRAYPTGASAVAATYGTVMPTMFGALAFKVPMILADVGTGWAVWRIALHLSGDEKTARRSFTWWFLNPIVIWVGSVHGQIDSLAAFGIALMLLALLNESWGLAGAALSFGVAVKISPIFLVPVVLAYLCSPTRRRSLAMWAQFALGAVVSALLFVAPEWGSTMLTGVLSRTAQVGPVGGLEWTGLAKSLPLLSHLYTWLSSHFVFATRTSNWLQILASLAGGIVTWRRPSGRTLLVTSGLVMMVVVSVNLVANPEFTLWFLPVVALGAGGVWAHQRLFRVSSVLMAIGVLVFYTSLFAPSYYFGVFGTAWGFPSVGSVSSQTEWLSRGGAHFTFWPAANWMRLDLVASLLVTGATILGVWALITALRSQQLTLDPFRWSLTRAARWSGVAVSAAIVLGGWIAPRLVALPQLTVVSPSNSSKLTLRSSSTSGVRVSAFRFDSARRVSQVVFFSDPTYPYVSSDAGTILGTLQQMVSTFRSSHVGIGVQSVTASSLGAMLPTLSPNALLVDLTGVFPKSVVESGDLQRWLLGGGRLAFGGYLPGVLSSGPASSLSAVRTSTSALALLPRGLTSGYLARETWVTAPSVWSSALHLSYPEVMFGLRTSILTRSGGTILGNASSGLTTVGYVPYGHGGVVIFTGSNLGEYEVDEGYALCVLVASNALAATGVPVSRQVGESLSTLPLPKGRGAVEVVATDASRPLWIWSRTLDASGGVS